MCLGRLYYWGVFDYLVRQYPHLAPMLRQGLIARRSWYLAALHLKLSQPDLDEAEAKALDFERTAWMMHDTRSIQARLAPKLEGYPDVRAHWIWRGKMHYNRPACYWDGVQGVSIHRLLWTHFRPRELLTDQDRPRKTIACPDDVLELRRCVNPFHFEYALPMKLQRTTRSRPGVRDDLTPPFKPIWHAGKDFKKTSAGDVYVACPNNPMHKPLGGKAQRQAFVDGLPRGRGYCAECYQLWVSHHPRTAVREYAGRTPQILSRAQLEERSKVQLDANADARRQEEKWRATMRALGVSDEDMPDYPGQ